MSEEEVKALFLLSGIEILKVWKVDNRYWPEVYVKERLGSPWWLVKTKFGCVEIGWRKRVIHIDWSDTEIRKEITEDDVTKSEILVHAWGYAKAIEYLTNLKVEFNNKV